MQCGSRLNPAVPFICADLGANIAYGYTMKASGPGARATGVLVFISALGGHEFKCKAATLLYIFLILFSVLVFVEGLTLPFPMWPTVLGY